MMVDFIRTIGDWRNVVDSARTTVGREPGDKEPSSSWKTRMLLAEHSPIRQLLFRWKWSDLMYWVSVHIVRHKVGIEHFVSTQRTDRTGIERDNEPQGAPVSHECLANSQAIITISRKRLCNKASPDTREAWKAFLTGLKDVSPELYSVCVRECLYRGFCPEMSTCGYSKTETYFKRLEEYRSPVNDR